MKLFTFFLFSLFGLAQDVTTIANAAIAARSAHSQALSLTASQGDGATCTITKIAGNGINATLNCASGSNKTSETVNAGGTAASSKVWGIDDVLCLLLLNPTSAAVTMGSVGPAPANSLAWSCTTNITAGGQTAIVAGSVSWP